MKDELYPFQKKALNNLRMQVAESLGSYHRTHAPQVVSFTAPTGAGKTIIIASLFEDIFYGNELYPEQPEAIFVWLSDSPELNEQSKSKIDTKSDRISLNQCVTIDGDSFDREVLEDGHVYFLNTQKLAKGNRLVGHADGRTYTIWETLQNTAMQKGDRLYFVIDEAHRGMQGREASKATSIMQKFIKGSPEDGLEAMPVVIGMSATPERFDTLVKGTSSTIHKVVVDAEEVRESGLLKDRIIITYPDDETGNKDMAVLQAAADEWKNKWIHWTQYCEEQHYAYINPIFVVQVLNGNNTTITETDLSDCLEKIEARTGFHFSKGEVVHCFGETAQLNINGLEIPYEEPSRISDDKNIKVVFFKESLSTGWDCPRAETMMSFRRASDATYIAQLLGRMVRTPRQTRILVDDSLNDVHLFLPHFDGTTVNSVVDELQKSEGGDIPADIFGEPISETGRSVLTIKPLGHKTIETKTDIQEIGKTPTTDTESAASKSITSDRQVRESQSDGKQGGTSETPKGNTPSDFQWEIQEEPEKRVFDDGIEREKIVKFINMEADLTTYDIRRTKIATSDLASLYAMTRLLYQSAINTEIYDEIKTEIVEMIHDYVEELKEKGHYDELVEKVLEFKLLVQIFDVFGESVDDYQEHDMLSATDTDIDRQLRNAEAKLGNEGISQSYGRRYKTEDDDIAYKMDVILFAADDNCQVRLNKWAKEKFDTLNDQYRRRVARLNSDKFEKQYNDLVSNSAEVSEHSFKLPETVDGSMSTGKEYPYHLFVNAETGIYKAKLNAWEEDVLKEEMAREDFVCWLRNPSRGSWALKIPYEYNGTKKPAYPDFLIIRSDPDTEYVVDILEPHLPKYDDNLPKAKGFAKYAKNNPSIGKIELIREGKDPAGNPRYFRLDLSKTTIREKVLRASTPEELNSLFDTHGEYK